MRKKKLKVWQIVILVILALGVIGSFLPDEEEASPVSSNSPIVTTASNSSSETTTKVTTTKATKIEDFTIEGDTTTKKDMFSLYIGGIIKNNRDKDYSYVQVTFVVYDKEGNAIGSAIDNINGLKAGKTWKFNAIFLGSESDEADSYELDEIIGF